MPLAKSHNRVGVSAPAGHPRSRRQLFKLYTACRHAGLRTADTPWCEGGRPSASQREALMSQRKRHHAPRPDTAAEEGMSMSNCRDSGESGEVIKMESSCTIVAVPSPRKPGMSTAGSRTATTGQVTGSPGDSKIPG